VTAFSYGQLEQLWIQAGGPKAMAPLMAAIALAESGGNPSANNYTDNGGTQTSWGLWQISNGTHSEPVPNIDNPLVNAQQAVAKYNGQGLSAWGTYDSGAYQQFYQGGVPPSKLPQGGGGSGSNTGGAGGVTTDSFTTSDITLPGAPWPNFSIQDIPLDIIGGFGSVGSTAGSIADLAKTAATVGNDLVHVMSLGMWLFEPQNWLRVGAFVAALIMGMGGVYFLLKASNVSMPQAPSVVPIPV
jgi:hypothetical protein